MSTDELLAKALRFPRPERAHVAEVLLSSLEESDALKRQEREIRSRIEAFSASDKLPREELHSRSL